jgi:hypothetical protein
MRTTLDIDQDILAAAKEISARTRRTTGRVLSDLARQALGASTSAPFAAPPLVNGFEVIPAGGRVVTSELVEKLLAEPE